MMVPNARYKALIIAGFITALMVTGIANLSYDGSQKSVLGFSRPEAPCSLIFCSLL